MSSRLTKRTFLGGAGAVVVGGIAALVAGRGSEASAETFEVNLTADQWRQRLTADQYYVLRRQGTERSGTSPLNREHRRGTYLCAGCDLPVYRSQDKFESGTGWPSFNTPVEGAVETTTDRSLGMTRTEVTYPLIELLLPELEEFLVYVWRRQLAAATGRVVQAADDEEMVDRRLAVGFADLVGFTRLTRRMEEEELGELVEAFETTAADLVAANGGRLIKTLGDEVLTPDSSRYWDASSYKPGGPQPSFDKQFVRDWLESTGWDKQSPPPPLPDDVVAKTRAKYIDAYEILTGQPFAWK